MQLSFIDAAPAGHETPLLAVGVTEEADASSPTLSDLDRALNGAVSRAMTSGDMRGRAADQVVLYGPAGGPERIVLLGLGQAESVDPELIRRMAGRAVRAA